MANLNEGRQLARIAAVEEHFRVENAHDLDGIMATFGEKPRFLLNTEVHDGTESIRTLYAELLHGFPDVGFEMKHRHVGDDAIVTELVLSGTHQNEWRGIPATRMRIEVPICAVFPFDENEKIAGERAYFDVMDLLRQLGVVE